MSGPFNEQLLPILPDRLKHPQQHQREWEPVLKKALGSHLDQMAESIRGFASARPKLLDFMSTYERTETAERIVREYVAEKLNNAPLHLLSEESTRDAREQQHGSPVGVVSYIDLEDDMDRIDRRSVTMAAEPVTSPSTQHPNVCMAPPPRPIAPVAPMSPITPVRFQAVAGPSNQSRSHVTENVPLRQAGKRLFDNLESEEQQQQQQTPPSPPKRAKPNSSSSSSLVTRLSIDVTRSLNWFDVDSDEYIFKDARCGSGWYVVRCNIGKMQYVNVPTRFTQHPFLNNLAMGHFNQKEKCHSGPTKEKYTEEMILQNFAFRVYYEKISKTDPSEEQVNESNDELKTKNLPAIVPGEEPSKGKGKKKAVRGRPRAEDIRVVRADTQETDASYREELIQEVVSYLVPVTDDDNT